MKDGELRKYKCDWPDCGKEFEQRIRTIGSGKHDTVTDRPSNLSKMWQWVAKCGGEMKKSLICKRCGNERFTLGIKTDECLICLDKQVSESREK